MNPFKFGVLVDDEYFTDRINELKEVLWTLNSENHLILISPRRFGKSSLVAKAVRESGRPCISLNMQNILCVEDFASKLLRELFRIYPMERIKHLMTHFRIIPTVSTNPLTNGIDVSFQPVMNSIVLLEDAMALIEKVSTEEKRLVVVFDEFQEVLNIRKGLDKQLRSVMQEQKHLNYILLGSQESMMTEIFERKKSPFYHFGKLMHLDKIPYEDFREYIASRLPLDEWREVAGLFAADVEGGFAEIVIEKTRHRPRVRGQPGVEGDVLVQRVAVLRVAGDRVRRALDEESSAFVEFAGFFAEAVEVVFFVSQADVGDPAAAVPPESASRERLVQDFPVAVGEGQLQGGFGDGHRQLFAGDRDAVFLLGHFRVRCLHAGPFLCEKRIQPVLPGCQLQNVGSFLKFLLRRHAEARADPDDLVRHDPDPDDGGICEDAGAVLFLPEADCFCADVHDASPCFRIN